MINEVLSAVVRSAFLLSSLNICLSNETFPMEWRRSRVLLLYKGRPKPIDESSSYRPISLLDGAGKLMKRLILNRIAEQIAIGLTPNQFGFCLGRRTTKRPWR